VPVEPPVAWNLAVRPRTCMIGVWASLVCYFGRLTRAEVESVQYGLDGIFIHTPDIHDAVFPLAEVADGRAANPTGTGFLSGSRASR